MPCEPVEMTAEQKLKREAEIEAAIAELEQGLKMKRIKALRDRAGNVTFQGWSQQSRRGCCDACTYRRLVERRSVPLQMALRESQTRAVTR
jgi:hypothetical protein